MDSEQMQQLLQGKYKLLQQLAKSEKKYSSFIVQRINQPFHLNLNGRKYIAKIQELGENKRQTNGKIVFEKKPRSALVLEEEIQILLDIERNIDKLGFPKAYDVYSLNDKRVIITDLRSMKLARLIPELSKNLSQTEFTKMGLKIIYDLLDRIQSIHLANYIHSYLRPEFINFKKQYSSMKDVLFISDYSKAHKFNEYNIKKQNYHKSYQYSIKQRFKNGFASVWSHSKIAKSRRDDIESFVYICIFILRGGKLPWDDTEFGWDQKKDKEIFQKKLTLIDSDIFQSEEQERQNTFQIFYDLVDAISNKTDLISKSSKTQKTVKVPREIRQILIETRNLGFQQQPNYHYIRKLIKKAMNRFQIVETNDYTFPISDEELYPKGF